MKSDIIIHNDVVKKYNWKKIVFALIVLIAIVSLIIVLIRNYTTRRRDVVWIRNIDKVSYDIPKEAQEEFGGYLYHLLRQHFEVPENGADIVANVRTDTFEVVKTGEINSVKFVIDVEDYNQSFDSSMSWSNSLDLPESARIECTKKEKSKYPDVMCYGMSFNSDSVRLYLPVDFNLDGGQKVQLEYGFTTSDGIDIVEVNVESCGNEALDKEAELRARQWVKAQGIDGDGLKYNVVGLYRNCVLKEGA